MKVKQKVKLRERQTSDTTLTLHLDWSNAGKRTREPLKLAIFTKPKNPLERQHNKETYLKAELIRQQREIQFFNDELDDAVRKRQNSNSDFYDYFDQFIEEYKKKDKRMIIAVRAKLFEFTGTPLSCREITESFCLKFKEYLNEQLNGESPSSYFARFKKVVRKAYKDKILKTNPVEDIRNFKTENSLQKDILSIDELAKLKETHCGNEIVKASFMFACNTGLRYTDIKTLKWKDVKENYIEVIQNKTDQKVSIPINENAKSWLPEKTQNDYVVFPMPSTTGIAKALKTWVKRAQIDKHITYHCARHTFGSLLAYYNNDVAVISKLLGHTSLKHTMKYVRIGEKMKQQAVNSIPKI